MLNVTIEQEDLPMTEKEFNKDIFEDKNSKTSSSSLTQQKQIVDTNSFAELGNEYSKEEESECISPCGILDQQFVMECESPSVRQPYSPGQNSCRSDVVRKSIIRGIKRYFCQIFTKGNSHIKSIKNKQGMESLDRIEEYCERNFRPKFDICDKEKVLNLYELLNYKSSIDKNSLSHEVKIYYEIKILIACMTLRIPLKKKFSLPFVKPCFTLIYDIFSKYSHSKLELLMHFRPFKIIFTELVEQGLMNLLITTDKTFSTNREAYTKNLEELINLTEEADNKFRN